MSSVRGRVSLAAEKGALLARLGKLSIVRNVNRHETDDEMEAEVASVRARIREIDRLCALYDAGEAEQFVHGVNAIPTAEWSFPPSTLPPSRSYVPRSP